MTFTEAARRDALLSRVHERTDPASVSLRSIALWGRVPRVLTVGRRGAGRSTLTTALGGSDGEILWLDPKRCVQWISTPGWRGPDHAAALEDSRHQAEKTHPDVVLLAIPATEVDAGVDDELRDLKSVLRQCPAKTPVVTTLTRSDEVAPPDASPPWSADETALALLERARETFYSHAQRHGVTVTALVATAARVEVTPRGVHDLRYNLDTLARTLTVTCAARLPRAKDRATELLRAVKRARVDLSLTHAEALEISTPWGWFGIEPSVR